MRRTLFGLLVGVSLIGSIAFGQLDSGARKQTVQTATRGRGSEAALGPTAFLYQGQLKDRGMPATGVYDVQFTLYSARTGGIELGSIIHEDLAVIDGLFTVELDFGHLPLENRENWLEASVRHGNSSETYAVLFPRQWLTPAPYAILAQQEPWSLIGVPVGFAEVVVAEKTDESLRDGAKATRSQSSQTRVTSQMNVTEYGAKSLKSEMKTDRPPAVAALAGPGTPNFIVRFDPSGNPSANSALFESGTNIGIGTTQVGGSKLEVVGNIVTRLSAGANGTALTMAAEGGGLGSLWTNNSYNPASPFNGWIRTINMVSGRVGIGTASPQAKLDINGTGTDNNGSTAVVRIVSGNGAQTLLLDGNEIDAVADGFFLNNNTNQKVIIANGGGNVGIGTANPAAKLDVAGTTRTRVLEITGGSDLAEPFEVSGAGMIKPGMVVAIDSAHPGRLRLASKAYDRTVAGIVSGANGINPGLTMRQDGTVADGSLPVALTGRVYCWADASYGSIEPGDLLTTSSTPGHAMKAADSTKAYGTIIGKTMSSLPQGRGLVLVLVTLQ